MHDKKQNILSRCSERSLSTIIVHTLKAILSPSLRRRVKALLGRRMLDEVEIIYETIKGKTKTKVMIDVGAYHGRSLEEFARSGWQIYAFEPDPNNLFALNKLCRRFPSVVIDSRAVSNRNENQCQFYTSKVSSGISSLSPFHPSHKGSYRVDTVTLETFCKKEGITDVGFLKVDAEGYDLFVLQGFPWKKAKPEVILYEFEDKKTIPLGYTFKDMADFLLDKGYYLLFSEWYPVIEYGSLHRWRCFSSYPCDLMDKNAWGNIVAVNEEEIYAYLLATAEKYEKRFS